MATKYPIVVHKDASSDYGAFLPDFPGCFTGGETIEEVLRNVQDAVECYMEGEDMDIPAPTPLDEVVQLEEAKEGIVLLADIDFSFLGKEVTRINLSLPKYALNQIDRAAKAAGQTRSAYLVECSLRCAI